MKFVVLGVGNRLRGDDAIGPEVIDFLKKQNPGNTLLIDCGSAPENFIGKINAAAPVCAIIVDAVDMKKPAGTVDVVKPGNAAGVIYSTHNAPPALFFRAVSGICQKVVFVGVQPKNTGFGQAMSGEAKKGVKGAGLTIMKIIQP